MNSKVVILGGSHSHTLSIARVFGLNGIKPFGIIIGKKSKHSFVKRSKFWQKVWSVDTDSEAIDVLKREFNDEELKPVLIPTSDGAAVELDKNLDELSRDFIMGNFNHEQGRIISLMNKLNQVDFVKKHLDLNMASSYIIDVHTKDIPEALEYPCIVKPAVSAEGNKGDIRRLMNRDELNAYLDVLSGKGYTRILAQKFLDIDYEFCLSGCCGEVISYFVSETVRLWPDVGGTGSLDRIMDDKDIHEECKMILKRLSDMKYSGLIDFDLFRLKSGEIYVGEINWRDSGRVFMCLGTKVFYPLVWYYSVTGQREKISGLNLTTRDSTQYGMNEQSDIRHVSLTGKEKERITFREWLKDCRKCRSFTLWCSSDITPAMSLYPKMFLYLFTPMPLIRFIKFMKKIIGK